MCGGTTRIRKILIDIIKEYNLSVFGIHLDLPQEVCLHLNHLRKFKNLNSTQKNESLPHSLIKSYFQTFQPLKLEEGFSKIIPVKKLFLDKNSKNDYFFMKYF
jgi:hypothetical protein